MSKTIVKLSLSAAMLFTALSSSAFAATEIQWWHAMGGTNGERVDKIAADFNATHKPTTKLCLYIKAIIQKL